MRTKEENQSGKGRQVRMVLIFTSELLHIFLHRRYRFSMGGVNWELMCDEKTKCGSLVKIPKLMR
jgi:hypothetical protein